MKSPASNRYWQRYWEQKRKKKGMEKGELDSKDFMQGIKDLVGRILEGCRAIQESKFYRFHQKESVGLSVMRGGSL